MKMSRNDILIKIKEIIYSADPSIAERFPSLNEDTRILEDLGFNSISMLFMAVSIEETFKIELDNVNIWDLRVLGDAVTMIEEQMK